MPVTVPVTLSALLRDLTCKWANAVARQDAPGAAYYAREIRVGALVLLTHSEIRGAFLSRAGLSFDLTADEAASAISGFFVAVSEATFGRVADPSADLCVETAPRRDPLSVEPV